MPANTILFAAFAPLALANAAPAAAAPIADADAFPASKLSRADDPDQRYCILWDIPNSHIRQKECRTLARWQARNIDPRQMPRRR